MALLALAALAPALPAHAQSDDERYSIMRPEPGQAGSRALAGAEIQIAARHPPARGDAAPATSAAAARAGAAADLCAGDRARAAEFAGGRVGAGRAETSQDRAARCAHQAGVYGQAAGDRNAYIGSCINQ